MALVPTNVTLSTSVLHPVQLVDVRAFDGSPITLLPGVAINLLNYATEEDLVKSHHLSNLLGDGLLTVNSSFDPATTQENIIVQWILSGDTILQFFGVNGPSSDNTYTGTFAAGAIVRVGVTNGVGVPDPFNNTATVVLSVTGGGAASPKINGSASPVTLTLVGGVASATVTASGAGTVLLGLSGGNTTLDRSDTATVTLS